MNTHTLKQLIKTENKKRLDITWCKKSLMKKIFNEKNIHKDRASRGVDDKMK